LAQPVRILLEVDASNDGQISTQYINAINSEVIVSTSSKIHTGCANFTQSTLIINDDSLDLSNSYLIVHTNQSYCSQKFNSVQVISQSLSNTCNLQVSQDIREQGLFVSFEVTKCEESDTVVVIIVCLLGIFVAICVIVIVLSLKNPYVRKTVFPFRDWKRHIPVRNRREVF